MSSNNVRQTTCVPHTQVERKYRENINMQLERLRWAVPTLLQAVGVDAIWVAKPSKGIMLAAAIDYVSRIERKRNAAMDDIERLAGDRLPGWAKTYGKFRSQTSPILYTSVPPLSWPSLQLTLPLQLFWVSECTYFALITFVKLQFLLFYLQIFPDQRFRRIVYCVITFNLISMTAFIFSCIFICSPISLAWTQWDGEHTGKCNNNNTLSYANASISILLDLVALSLPIPEIWKLQLSLRKKIGVLLMFSVGAFVTIVSILRLRAFTYFAKTRNVTWDFTEASLWSIIEWEVGIICSCMPAMRLGLARLFPKILDSTAHSTYKSTNGMSLEQSGRNTLQGLGTGGISAKTTFRVSHMRKTQSIDNEDGFVQLVEIDAGTHSAAASTRSLTGECRQA
ncbi:hypothetical protein yc1106_02099 [Curvularia clavata]|uniref:BHLH domain-containing protein n=1 Tax=Curvularia clavata TaxID=95742 RepID=A0A9Q8Z461_CURCL|nr:hypothetical protein yc1106_02099 [Curvularia clavata]